MKYEVLIVGAGPAGAMAAYLLARQGRRVLLLERSQFPRPKVCGDCLNPRVRPLLEKVGLWREFQQLPQHTIQGLQLERDGQVLFHQTFTDDSFRSISRSILDSWLTTRAQEAGAEVHFLTPVTAIDSRTGLVRTETKEYQADLILAADGRNSLAARSSGLLPSGEKCPRVGWQTTLSLPHLDQAVHLNVFDGGYYGLVKINPVEANLCLVLDAKSRWKPNDVLARFFSGQTASDWRSIHPIKRVPAQASQDRLWLLGDTARVVEPFTGEGIYFAMASAHCAFQTLLSVPCTTPPDFLAKLYRRNHRRLYEGELGLNRLTRWLLEKSSRGHTLLPFLKKFPALLRSATERVVLSPKYE